MNQGVERPIDLEQQFDLFPTQETFVQPLDMYPRLKRRVALQIPQIPAPLPIDIRAIPKRTKKLEVLTPFNLQIGYQIDEKDYHAAERITKYCQLSNLLRRQMLLLEAPLAVSAGLPDFRSFTSDLERIGRLRLVLSCPGKTRSEIITYESQSKKAAVKAGMLAFELFYPAGRGPLAVPVGRFVLRMDELKEGCNIHLPWNLEEPAEYNLARLSQIKGSFYLDTGIPWAFRRAF